MNLQYLLEESGSHNLLVAFCKFYKHTSISTNLFEIFDVKSPGINKPKIEKPENAILAHILGQAVPMIKSGLAIVTQNT